MIFVVGLILHFFMRIYRRRQGIEIRLGMKNCQWNESAATARFGIGSLGRIVNRSFNRLMGFSCRRPQKLRDS